MFMGVARCGLLDVLPFFSIFYQVLGISSNVVVNRNIYNSYI
jgi:hypothetical protein